MRHVNWSMFTCAAAATGLLAGSEADGAILVTPTGLHINDGGARDYNIDGIGAHEFRTDYIEQDGAERYYLKSLNADNQFKYAAQAITPFENTDYQVKPFQAGDVIGPAEFFSNDSGDSGAGNYRNNLAGLPEAGGGLFSTDDTLQYIGFSWDQNGDGVTEYGWIAIRMTDPTSPTGRLLIETAAWDNTGAPIVAGAVPEPAAGLAVLAMGAVGLLRRRQ